MHMTTPSLLLLSACLGLSACSKDEKPVAAPVQPVRIFVVGATSSDNTLSATGLVGSQEEAKLSFKTGGIINSLRVDAGRSVKRGQILATLDSTEVDAQVNQAEENVIKLKRDRDRAEHLLKLEVIPAREAQDTRTQLAQAEAQLSAARFNRQFAVITAPADGVVLQRLAEPREVAAAGAPILIVSRDDLGWVLRIGLNDKAAVSVKVGDAVEVTLKAYPEHIIRSQIKDIGGASDLRSGTVNATISLPTQTDIRYIAGQVGEARIVIKRSGTPVLTLPLASILEANGEQATVYVISAKKQAELRRVRVGKIHDSRVDIVSGLVAGERVVSEGAAWLNPGMPVRILP